MRPETIAWLALAVANGDVSRKNIRQYLTERSARAVLRLADDIVAADAAISEPAPLVRIGQGAYIRDYN